MKLLVIGQSVEDHFEFGGKKVIKPGGIFYSTAGLCCFKSEEDEIFLATSVEKKKLGLFELTYPKLNQKYFTYVDSIPKVYLSNLEGEIRHEKYNHITEPLALSFDGIDEFDGILINMITGFDIKLEDLKKIRSLTNAPIYFDVHSLSRGLDDNMHREPRVIPNFNEWARHIDIIQVNETELHTLNNKKSEEEILFDALLPNLSFIIVTRGGLGAEIFFKDDGIIKSIFQPAIKVEAGNKVGCGDVFGAVFFYSYIKNKNINEALNLAVTAAGLTASMNDIHEFTTLKENVFARYNKEKNIGRRL